MTESTAITAPAVRLLPTPHTFRETLEARVQETQREPLWWFYNFARTHKLDCQQAGELINLASSSCRLLFKGEYPAGLDKVIERINAFREGEASKGAPFIMTPLAKEIFKVCRFAATHRNVAFVYGESQTGKTYALKRFQAENNHGKTLYLRCPAFGGVDNLLGDFCEMLHLNSSENTTRRRSRILRTLGPENLLIIDEFHALFLGRGVNLTIACCEFVREVHDRTGCGLVICGTNAIPKQLDKGELSAVLNQLGRRGITRLALPDTIGEADILAIAHHYGLDAPEPSTRAVIDRLLDERGISAFIKFLDAARSYADKKSLALDWPHFLTAVRSFTRLSSK